MTYEQLVEKVKGTYESADAKKINEHVAIQFNIEGEAEGAFYLEIADSKIKVGPYEYYDRDVVVITTAAVLTDIADGKLTVEQASNAGNLRTEGNTGKAFLLDQVTVKAKKAVAKKTTAKKDEPKAAAKKATKATEKKAEAKVETKTETKKAETKKAETKEVKAEAKTTKAAAKKATK